MDDELNLPGINWMLTILENARDRDHPDNIARADTRLREFATGKVKADDQLVAKALAKLSPEERRALGW